MLWPQTDSLSSLRGNTKPVYRLARVIPAVPPTYPFLSLPNSSAASICDLRRI